MNNKKKIDIKELTIEQKAKAYDEAKLRMSAAYNSNRCTISFMNEIFPELKESEDEKISKEIITWMKGAMGSTIAINRDKWIAWLEKQGELVEINPTEFDTRLQNLIGQFNNLPKEEVIGILGFWLNVVKNDGTYKEEKQDEQKCWKPNDEQMEALEHFVRSIGESGYASPYDNNTKLLYSLLSDLKKLREE